jgi:hypothetical protein
VVQPGQDWDGDNDTRPLDRPTQGRILAQRQARARLIVIRRIRSKNSPQVRLTKDQQSIQALAAHGADQPFRIAILPWRSRRDRSVADTYGIDLISSTSSMRELASQRWKRNSGSWSELRCRGSDFPPMIRLNIRQTDTCRF